MSEIGDDSEYFRDEAKLAELLKSATSPEFWRRLCPDLTISHNPFCHTVPYHPLSAGEATGLVRQVVEDGYFQTGQVFQIPQVARLAATVSTVVAAGFHPLFATVYDEFWGLLRSLDGILKPILGENYLLVPDHWVWHIGADALSAGWKPHRDYQHQQTIRKDGRPTFLITWIPLTDATPDNSCIYVLPLCLDPNYPDHPEKRNIEQIQNIRALPAKAGSVLGWNQYLLHWGSRSSSRANHPRISWGIYFQSGDVAPYDRLARRPDGIMGFQQRLGYIGSALGRYSKYFPLPFPLRAFELISRKWTGTNTASGIVPDQLVS